MELLDVPLYLQIATRIRHRIASRALLPGERLPPLRQAAIEWGVNLHTVRRAYEELEAEGLARTQPRVGTTVAAVPDVAGPGRREDIRAFVEWISHVAVQRYGISPVQLAEHLRSAGDAQRVLWVLECSDSLARSLAQQIAQVTDGVEVRPWLVQHARETPPGMVLATYYHYVEVLDAFEASSRTPQFFGVELDRSVLRRVGKPARAARRLILLAVQAASGGALREELEEFFRADGISIDLRLTQRPAAALRGIPSGVPVLVSPENWDQLGVERDDSRVHQLRLRPTSDDLARIGAMLQLRAQPWG